MRPFNDLSTFLRSVNPLLPKFSQSLKLLLRNPFYNPYYVLQKIQMFCINPKFHYFSSPLPQLPSSDRRTLYSLSIDGLIRTKSVSNYGTFLPNLNFQFLRCYNIFSLGTFLFLLNPSQCEYSREECITTQHECKSHQWHIIKEKSTPS